MNTITYDYFAGVTLPPLRVRANERHRRDARYMRLALKAQSQCRATIETRAEIKNPRPIAFAQQANIANGPQQVNNGGQVPAEPSCAEKSENQQSILLEKSDGERLDFGAKGAIVGANTPLETVGVTLRQGQSASWLVAEGGRQAIKGRVGQATRPD
jgi:hypothetical protein